MKLIELDTLLRENYKKINDAVKSIEILEHIKTDTDGIYGKTTEQGNELKPTVVTAIFPEDILQQAPGLILEAITYSLKEDAAKIYTKVLQEFITAHKDNTGIRTSKQQAARLIPDAELSIMNHKTFHTILSSATEVARINDYNNLLLMDCKEDNKFYNINKIKFKALNDDFIFADNGTGIAREVNGYIEVSMVRFELLEIPEGSNPVYNENFLEVELDDTRR